MTVYELTKKHKHLRKTVETIAREVLAPVGAHHDGTKT
jgi:hypothetical protein